MKKLGLLFATVIMMMLFAVSASAAREGYYTYQFANGVATITDVDESISGDITIPHTLGGYSVIAIGYHAFRDCTRLTSITIPDSVTSIGSGAFSYCIGLTSIVIPDSVTSIGDMAFSSCTRLTSITIPDSITSIGYRAFSSCTRLTSITIPDSIMSIGDEAFFCCLSLTNITVDADNAYYSSDNNGVLFNQNKAKLIQYPAGNTSTLYTIPDSVISIEKYAFYSCENLTNITVPDSVTSIGKDAFYYCGLTDVYYTGAENQWDKIDIETNNQELTDARIHYLYDPITHYETTVTAPTCTAQGYTTYTCKCGYSYRDNYVGTKAHSYTSVVTEATCEKAGYTIYICTCGDTYTGNLTPAKGHNYDEGICITCGDGRLNNCSCKCHKSGFMGFIWKITLFFNKLFKTNRECACGVVHY